MVDPVVSSDGHTYERANIEQWFTLSNRSPKTNLPLRNKELFPNLALKETIEEAVLSHLFSRPGLWMGRGKGLEKWRKRRGEEREKAAFPSKWRQQGSTSAE
jgi:U-box domain